LAAVSDEVVLAVSLEAVGQLADVPHQNRARSLEKATVLRQSSKATAYRYLRFIKQFFSRF
jgi:hypothetical protein